MRNTDHRHWGRSRVHILRMVHSRVRKENRKENSKVHTVRNTSLIRRGPKHKRFYTVLLLKFLKKVYLYIKTIEFFNFA